MRIAVRQCGRVEESGGGDGQLFTFFLARSQFGPTGRIKLCGYSPKKTRF